MKDTKYFAEIGVATISKLFTINHMSEKCSLFHRKESNQEVCQRDILWASWKAPATNFSRATLFDRETSETSDWNNVMTEKLEMLKKYLAMLLAELKKPRKKLKKRN